MSALVMGLCYEVTFGCPRMKAVAVALGDHASHDGTKVFPSVALIARKVELSERTVQRTLRALEAAGVIVVVRDGGAGPGNTREWCFDLHLLRSVAEGKATLQIDKGDSVTPFKGDSLTPIEEGLRVTPTTAKGDTRDTKGDTGDTQTSTNHQEELSAPLPPRPVGPPHSGQIDSIVWKTSYRPALRIKPGDVGWTQWAEHVEATFGERDLEAMVAAGEIIVSKRWPDADSPMPKIGRP